MKATDASRDAAIARRAAEVRVARLVLRALGKPPRLLDVTATEIGLASYRVNVWVEYYPLDCIFPARRIIHSYYVVANGDKLHPPVRRIYR